MGRAVQPNSPASRAVAYLKLHQPYGFTPRQIARVLCLDAKDARRLFAEHPYLTQLYTTLSPAEMVRTRLLAPDSLTSARVAAPSNVTAKTRNMWPYDHASVSQGSGSCGRSTVRRSSWRLASA